ncbi:hypothetical protein DY000_02033992 [Brassica cretica]|uniref:CASP-like protein n=1 Tax=Brassica cretica TaxID=69181 RepID=A0ABQ7DPK2_BRACR|nr:hypothetical protein DY000_02033992 [Brassica cretica]
MEESFMHLFRTLEITCLHAASAITSATASTLTLLPGALTSVALRFIFISFDGVVSWSRMNPE